MTHECLNCKKPFKWSLWTILATSTQPFHLKHEQHCKHCGHAFVPDHYATFFIISSVVFLASLFFSHTIAYLGIGLWLMAQIIYWYWAPLRACGHK